MRRCRDICRYGANQRLHWQTFAARKLLKKVGGPFFELRVGRQSWRQPCGGLHKVSLAAVKQVERNALDKLRMPSIAAVGMMKAAYMPDERHGSWHVEIHQIIAGVSRKEIRNAFATRLDNNRENYLWIDKIKNLTPAIGRVLDQSVMVRQRPDQGEEPARPRKEARGEYYRWTLGFRNGARVIRYGCDQHFNHLTKKRGRTIKAKFRKRRNAWWLERFQFGSDYWANRGKPGDI
jgi:hypothetical protein